MSGDQIAINGTVTGPHLTGPTGATGATGATGTVNLGTFATVAALQTANPAASYAGYQALVGSSLPYVNYISTGASWIKMTLQHYVAEFYTNASNQTQYYLNGVLQSSSSNNTFAWTILASEWNFDASGAGAGGASGAYSGATPSSACGVGGGGGGGSGYIITNGKMSGIVGNTLNITIGLGSAGATLPATAGNGNLASIGGSTVMSGFGVCTWAPGSSTLTIPGGGATSSGQTAATYVTSGAANGGNGGYGGQSTLSGNGGVGAGGGSTLTYTIRTMDQTSSVLIGGAGGGGSITSPYNTAGYAGGISNTNSNGGMYMNLGGTLASYSAGALLSVNTQNVSAGGGGMGGLSLFGIGGVGGNGGVAGGNASGYGAGGGGGGGNAKGGNGANGYVRLDFWA